MIYIYKPHSREKSSHCNRSQASFSYDKWFFSCIKVINGKNAAYLKTIYKCAFLCMVAGRINQEVVFTPFYHDTFGKVI